MLPTQKQTNSNVITPSLLAQKRYHATQLNLESKVLALTTRLARAVRPKLTPPKDKSAFLVGNKEQLSVQHMLTGHTQTYAML